MNLAENISAAFKVVNQTHKAVSALLDKLKAEYDKEKYLLLGDKFMRWSSDTNYGGWCYQTFQLAYQRLEDGEKLPNSFINGPIYIIEINFWQFATPKIVVAKFYFDGLCQWRPDYIGPAQYYRYAAPLHEEKKDLFSRTDLPDEITEISILPGQEEKVKLKYDGFKVAYATNLELVDINGENYLEQIFGAVEKLHVFKE